MPLKNRHRVLIVDDEESITHALHRLFRNADYEISTALSGKDALAILHGSDRPFSLIISDQRMPEMTGVEFLAEAKKIFPDAIRVLLTGYADVDAIIDAINRGGVHRYISKPWNDQDMLFQVEQSLERYELVEENRRLLELTNKQNLELSELNKDLESKVKEKASEIIRKNDTLTRLNLELEANLYSTVKAFSSFAERQDPVLAGHERRVGHIASEIAKALKYPENEVIHVEIAGLLHDIGKIGFSHRLMDYKEDEWSAADKEAYRKHPRNGQDIVQFIKKLDHVGIMVRTHHERYDGLGFPDKLKDEEIPLGARIVAVADAYDKIVNLKIDLDKAITKMKEENTKLEGEPLLRQAAVLHLRQESLLKYDPDVTKVLLTIIREKKLIPEGYKIVTLNELEQGMILTKPLYSSSGRFLLPPQTAMTVGYIQKLKMLSVNDPVTEDIFVQR
jgi:response regulator RpfG family c-di-GMP phosphodiesterase